VAKLPDQPGIDVGKNTFHLVGLEKRPYSAIWVMLLKVTHRGVAFPARSIGTGLRMQTVIAGKLRQGLLR
jgi:hypothetical protein